MLTNENLARLRERDDLKPSRFTAVGQEFRMGRMKGIVTALPVVDVVALHVDEVITRRDYELEGIDPGNRVISPAHVKKIKEGLRKHADKLLTGTFTLAIDPEGVDTSDQLAEIGNELFLTRFKVLSGHPIFIVDAQHRSQALRELWDDTVEATRQGQLDPDEVEQLLKVSSVPVLLLLESDKDEISRMFVTMASTKPISPSLIAVMDREQFANRLGLEVAQRSQLLASAQRLAYQTSTATGENLYAAAAVRGAAANMFIGFRDRTPDMRESNLRAVFTDRGMDPDAEDTVATAADEVVSLLDYAYARIPGWAEMHAGNLEPKVFRSEYVHGTASGLYVVAGTICAAKLSPGVDPEHVIDLLSEHFSWRKDDRVSDGKVMRHPDFEGTLVVTEGVINDDGEIDGWRSRTAGGARTNYEKATRAVIDKLVKLDDALDEMHSDAVLMAMGLKASGKRGRPRKS